MEVLAWLALEADRPELILALAFHSRKAARVAERTTAGLGTDSADDDCDHSAQYLQLLQGFEAAVGSPLAPLPSSALSTPLGQQGFPVDDYIAPRFIAPPSRPLGSGSADGHMLHLPIATPSGPSAAPHNMECPPPGTSIFGAPPARYSQLHLVPPPAGQTATWEARQYYGLC